jgi:tetratricopeptide (TPR) repeat protein
LRLEEVTIRLAKTLDKHVRLAPTVVLVAVVLLASWMGTLGGGYFVSGWAPPALVLSALALIASLVGVLSDAGSWRANAALGLFAAYTVWTFASLLWSPNRGDAWLGAGETMLYLLAFWVAAGLVSLGATRRWVLAASAIGPAIVAALTLLSLTPARIEELFLNGRLEGTIGYRNGEAAFLLVSFWAAIYTAGSRSVSPLLRGLILAGTVLSVNLAILTQSRGAMVAMVVSLPVFFLFSGQRVRGLFALAPVALTLLFTFPGLNEVHQALVNEEEAPLTLMRVLPTVWLAAAAVGLYGVLWGLADRRWELTSSATRLVGGVALAGGIAVLVFGLAAASERAGNPVAWAEQRWEAFKNDDAAGEEQSRYLAATGSGRYTMWQVAWEDFASRPLLGIGTQNYEATHYQLREKDVGYLRQPHSLPLEVLSERGLIGGILFFGFLATCLGSGLWQRFKNLSPEGKGQIGAMVAAITYWFVHSSAEWFWQFPAVTLPVMVYLAMLVGPWGQLEVVSARWPLRLVGAGVTTLAVAAVAPLYAADHYLEQSRTSTDWPEALEAVERAQRFNPVSPELHQQEAKLALQSGDWEWAEDELQEALRLNPEHYHQYELLAQFHELRGEPEAALSYYREALALNPLDSDLEQSVAELSEQDS